MCSLTTECVIAPRPSCGGNNDILKSQWPSTCTIQSPYGEDFSECVPAPLPPTPPGPLLHSMCVCVCVCVCVYIHTFIHAYIHTFMHTYIHTYTHTHTHTHTNLDWRECCDVTACGIGVCHISRAFSIYWGHNGCILYGILGVLQLYSTLYGIIRHGKWDVHSVSHWGYYGSTVLYTI